MSDSRAARKREFAVHPDQVRRYLKNLPFPADKDRIVRHVRRQGAPDAVVDAVMALPEGRYETPPDVMQVLRGRR